MITAAKIKSQLITDTVLSYFRGHAREVYEGTATTRDVCKAVEKAMYNNGFVYTCRESDEAYDAIRLYGPGCESGLAWLAAYSKRSPDSRVREVRVTSE